MYTLIGKLFVWKRNIDFLSHTILSVYYLDEIN